MKRTLIPLLVLFAVLILPWTASAADVGQGTERTRSPKAVKTRHAAVATKHRHHSARKTRVAEKSSIVHRHGHRTRAGKHSRSRHHHLARRPDPVESYTGTHPILRSSVALVVDQDTGESIYAKNPEQQAPIASITKLMTALVTLDAHLPLDEDITISNEDVDHLKNTHSRLGVGSAMTRGELLHLALIASENRAAAALSRCYPGGREAFVVAMNNKARELGMESTHYVDGTGLSSDNRSTAADLAKLVDAAYRYPLIRQITTTGSYDVDVPVGSRVRHLAYNNTNALTRHKDWDIGVSKTGYINEAGHCLVMQAEIASKDVIIVLLDSWGKQTRIGDARRIRKWLEYQSSRHVASHASRENV